VNAPLKRMRWQVRVATDARQLARASWEEVSASSEDRAAVAGVIAAECYRPGVVRHELVVEVRRAGVSTHWAVSCAGEGYGAYSLNEDSADDEDTHDAEDCDGVSTC